MLDWLHSLHQQAPNSVPEDAQLEEIIQPISNLEWCWFDAVHNFALFVMFGAVALGFKGDTPIGWVGRGWSVPVGTFTQKRFIPIPRHGSLGLRFKSFHL